MSESRTKSTVLGLATGVGVAAVLIGLSVWWQAEPAAEPEKKQVVTSQREKVKRGGVRSELRHFRDHDQRQGKVASDQGRPMDGSDSSARALAILLKELPGDLSRAEVALLFNWLKAGPGESSLAIDEYASLANEVMNALHRQEPSPSGFAEVVVGLVDDGNQPDLVRDYAVQHLRAIWNNLPDKAVDRDLVTKALWEQADSRHPSRSGTALLALHQLGMTREGPIPEGTRFIADQEFSELLPPILSLPDEPSASRVTALRIIADRALADHLPEVRNLANDSSQNAVVRLRAIATLGAVGEESDLESLSSLRDDAFLGPAVVQAIKKLSDPS